MDAGAGTHKVWGLQEEVAQDALIPYFSFCTESLIYIAGKAALQIEFHALKILVHTLCRLYPIDDFDGSYLSEVWGTQCSSVSSSS